MEMNYQKAITILGLNDNFTGDELKKAYYKLAKQYHPDINSDKIDAAQLEETLKEINAAKEYLEGYLKTGSENMYSSTKNSDTQEEPKENIDEETLRKITRFIISETAKYESNPLYSSIEHLIRQQEVMTIKSLLTAKNPQEYDLIVEQMHIDINRIFEIAKRFKKLNERVEKLDNPTVKTRLANAFNKFGSIPFDLTEQYLDSIEQYINLYEEKAIISVKDARKKLTDIKSQLGKLSSINKSKLKDFSKNIGRRSK